MSTDLERAARGVADAVLAHARAVDGADPARPAAASALTRALAEYGAEVIDAGGEPLEDLDDFEPYLDERDGVEVEPEPAIEGERLALFVRADFAVTDWPRLRAAGREQFMACCGDTDDDPDNVVRTAADALEHLVGHRPLFDLLGLSEAGVVPLAETAAAVGVDWTMDDPDTIGLDPWAPLRELSAGDEA